MSPPTIEAPTWLKLPASSPRFVADGLKLENSHANLHESPDRTSRQAGNHNERPAENSGLVAYKPGLHRLRLQRAVNRLYVLVFVGALSTFTLMMPGKGGGRGRRDPPFWAPEHESSYPFRHYTQDLIAWSILNTDLDSSQQTAAIVLNLGGAAR